MGRWIFFPLVVIACAPFLLRAQDLPDGVTLSIVQGPGPLEVTLTWSGGEPPFRLFRSTSPSLVVDPANLLGETADRSWIDLPPGGGIFYYRVTSPCVYNPPEVCDGIDNDCDGAIPPEEADADRDGVRICAWDCDDAHADVFPGHAEICDGIDNDCDGTVDAFDTACGVGGCSATGRCEAGADLCIPGQPAAEICDGIDNDCDGIVDEETCLYGCNVTRNQCNECDPLDANLCREGVAIVCDTEPPGEGTILSRSSCAYGCEPGGDFCFHPDTCDNPYLITGPDFGPATFSDDFGNYRADVAGSCGAAGDDVIHRIDIPASGTLSTFATILMSSAGSAVDTALHINRVCGSTSGELQYASVVCGASTGSGNTCANTGGGTETLRACGMPNGTYFATLDSAVSTGAFTLTLAVDSVNLDVCREAGNVSNVPFWPTIYTSSTTAKANDYRFDLVAADSPCPTGEKYECFRPNGDPTGSSSWTCSAPDGGAFGEDIVFYYRASATGFLTVDTQGSSFDTILYIKNTCLSACTISANCLRCNDDHRFLSGQYWSRIYRFPVTAGALYYIFVDGYGGEDGAVQLNVTFSAN